jgi:hypothetical protein
MSGAAATVVVVAGRRVDAPEAAVERFPLHKRDSVRDAIAAVLAGHSVSTVVSSAACGADLLALEAARALRIRRRVILPFPAPRFRATSVVDRPGDWGPLFDALVAEATAEGNLVVLGNEEGDTAYAKANSAILDEGDALASAAQAAKRALIVWDGASRGGDDLTEQFRTEAASRGWRVEEISTR